MIATPTRGAIHEASTTRKLMMQDTILLGGMSQGLQVTMGLQTMTLYQELHIKGLTMILLQELRVKGLTMTLLQELRVKGLTMTLLQELRLMGLNMTHHQERRNKDQVIVMEYQEPRVKSHIVALIQELHLKGPSMMIPVQGLHKRVTMTPRIELQGKKM